MFLREVLPEICQNLTNLSPKSYLKDRGSAYRYTQEYKLQLIVLQKIAQIVSDLDMSKDHVTVVLQSITTYLSCKQPLPLQVCYLDILRSRYIIFSSNKNSIGIFIHYSKLVLLFWKIVVADENQYMYYM